MAKKKKNNSNGGGGSGGGGSHCQEKQQLRENEKEELLSGFDRKLENHNDNDNGEKNRPRGSIAVVLQVDMHCEGCCNQVKRSLHGFEGTEKVITDIEKSTITVIGNVDPIRIRDRLQKKLKHKHVELISPIPPKNPVNPIKRVKPPTEPPISSIVLKILLHCDGCIMRIRKTVLNIKGVASVSMEPKKDLVTVRGTMDVKTLPKILERKLKRTVEIVRKKDEDNQGRLVEGGGCNKQDPTVKEAERAAAMCAEIRMMEYLNYTQVNLHPPQYFSDENPNACYIM